MPTMRIETDGSWGNTRVYIDDAEVTDLTGLHIWAGDGIENVYGNEKPKPYVEVTVKTRKMATTEGQPDADVRTTYRFDIADGLHMLDEQEVVDSEHTEKIRRHFFPAQNAVSEKGKKVIHRIATIIP